MATTEGNKCQIYLAVCTWLRAVSGLRARDNWEGHPILEARVVKAKPRKINQEPNIHSFRPKSLLIYMKKLEF